MKTQNESLSIVQKCGLAMLFLAGSLPVMAADAAAEPAPLPMWSDPVFITLVIIACGLVFVIYLLGKLLVSVLGRQIKASLVKPAVPAMLLALLVSGTVSAEPEAAAPAVSTLSSHAIALYLLSGLILAELIVVLFMAYAVLRMVKPAAEPKAGEKKTSLLEKLNASVAIEQEKDIMLDHDYDGIRELDNNLPPWWKYGFYATIVFSIVYLVHYHVSGSGKLQLAEYEEQVKTASIEVEAYKKNTANQVDENNITLLTEPAAIAAGQATFTANCAACHGQKGEGTVGPNLTDAYWLHGGSLSDVFKSIKYGWPEKGMKSWKADLGAKQIQELTSFIRSLQGSNPPNAKEQQGDPYEETAGTPPEKADSTSNTAALQL